MSKLSLRTRIALAIAASWAATLTASAQGIYRCANAYSQLPCVDGAVVNASDPRTAEQAADTARAAQRDQRAADAMERERLRQQGLAAPAYVAQPSGTLDKSETPRSGPGKPRKPEQFQASAPQTQSNKNKKTPSATSNGTAPKKPKRRKS